MANTTPTNTTPHTDLAGQSAAAQPPEPTKLSPVGAAQVHALQQLGHALPQATRDEIQDLHTYLQTLPPDTLPDPVATAVEQAQALPDATVAMLKQHLQAVAASASRGTPDVAGIGQIAPPAATQRESEPDRPLPRLQARLDAWATDLERWGDARAADLDLLALVTREHPESPQLAAVTTQLHAMLEQLRAMRDQLRAMHTQLAALDPATGELRAEQTAEQRAVRR